MRALPALIVLAVDSQTVKSGSPVELGVAAVQTGFQGLLVHIAAIEELKERVGRRVGVLLVALAQLRVIADDRQCGSAEILREFAREAAGLELGVTAHVVARDVGTAVVRPGAVAAGATQNVSLGPTNTSTPSLLPDGLVAFSSHEPAWTSSRLGARAQSSSELLGSLNNNWPRIAQSLPFSASAAPPAVL